MNTTGSTDPTGPNPALMSALTTEHYTLQSARASTIAEANGRSMLFLSSVSGATVALALVAQLDQIGNTFLTFALSVLPALLALGVTSHSRLADLAVHDAYYARGIGRIRAFYLTIEPGAHAAMGQAGQPHSRWHHLGHTATSVAAVVAVIMGVFLGLVGSAFTPVTTSALAAGATVLAAAIFAVLLADQERRWRRFDASLQSHFLSDGTPTMPVTALGHGTALGRGRVAFAAPSSADSGQAAPDSSKESPAGTPARSGTRTTAMTLATSSRCPGSPTAQRDLCR